MCHGCSSAPLFCFFLSWLLTRPLAFGLYPTLQSPYILPGECTVDSCSQGRRETVGCWELRMPLGDSAVLHVPALFLCPRNVFSAFPLPSYEWPQNNKLKQEKLCLSLSLSFSLQDKLTGLSEDHSLISLKINGLIFPVKMT